MAGNIKGLTIEFNGETTKLKKAMRDIKSESRSVDKELKDINRALKFNPNNVELLSQKQGILKTKIQATENQLKQFKAAQKQLEAQGIDNTNAEWRNLEREIAQNESRLKHFNKELKKVKSPELVALGNRMRTVGNEMKGIGTSMTTSVTVPIAAGFAYAAKEASDFEENLNKIDVAFGDSADQVKEWANTATQEFGLSKNSALEMAAQFGDMGTSMGLTDGAAADMSMTLAGLAGDLASFKNISTDQAMTALNGVFTGETESLKTLGVVMTQTNLEDFAQKQGLVYKEMSEAEKVTLRYQYVLEKTKNAQGDYANTSDGTANSIRTFRETLSNLAIVIGENLLPIITPIIQKVTQLAEKFGQMSPTMQKIVVIGGLIVGAIGPIIMIVGTLASAIGALIPIFSAVSLAAIAPFLGIAAAIAAAIAAGVLIYKNWDKIKAKAIEVGTAIKTGFQNAVASVKNTFANVGNAIATPFTQAASKVKAIINKIKKLFPINIGKILKNLKLPHFSLSMGSKDFGKLGSIKYPKGFSVKWYKTGGIVDGATLIGAGEAGPEAIVPLSGNQMKPFTDAVAKNLNLGIDYGQMAAAIAEAMQSVVTTTVLNVNGRAVAETTAPFMAKEINAVRVRDNRKLGLAGV